MSAQLYLSRLVDDGRTHRGLRRASLRTGGPARVGRVRRVLKQRKP
jgi:hypothetical protein